MKSLWIGLGILTTATATSACGILPTRTSSSAFLGITHIQTQTGQQFRVMHALQENDLPSWNASEKALIDFVDYWNSHGVNLGAAKLTISVMPDPKLPKAQVLTQLYGSEFSKAAANYRSRLENATSAAEMSSIAREAFCEFPPLLSGYAYVDSTFPLEKMKAKALGSLDVFANPERPELPGFKPENAYAGYIPESGCGAIVLGRSSNPAKKYDAFGAPDIVQHEMGHVFHGLIWNSQNIISFKQLSMALNEALADLFAHSYNGDYCHNKLPEVDPDTGEKCGRVMNKHGLPLRQDVVENSLDGHDNNQALRHFLWDLRSEVGQEMFAPNFIAAIKDVTQTLVNNKFETPSTRDIFLEEAVSIRRNLRPMEDFLNAICSRASKSNTCANVNAYLGTDVSQQIADFVENAPSKMLGTWKSQMLNGRLVWFRFVTNAQTNRINMEIKNALGEVITFQDNGATAMAGEMFLNFLSPGEPKQYALWSTRGVLSFQ